MRTLLLREGSVKSFFYSAYARILVSYISILILVMGVNIYLFLHVKDILVSKEISISSEYLKHTSMIIDGRLQHVKESMYSFLQDSENVKKMNEANGEINRQLQVIHSLSAFKNNISIIDQSYVYNQSLPFVIGVTGTDPKESILPKIFGEGAQMDEGTEMLNHIDGFRIVSAPNRASADPMDSQEGSSAVAADSSALYLAAGIGVSGNNNKMLVGIDEGDIQKILNNTNIVNYGSVIMVDSSGRTIYNSNPDETKPFTGKDLLKTIHEVTDPIAAEYQKQLVVYKKSDFFDGYYITVTPHDHILTKIKTIQHIFLYALLILALLGVGISLLYSRMFYNPISRLLAIFKSNKERSNGKSDFVFLQGLIESVHRKNEEYEESTILMKCLENGCEVMDMDIRHLFKHDESLAAILKGNITFQVYQFIQEYVKQHVPSSMMIKVAGGKEWECNLIFNVMRMDLSAVKEYLLTLRGIIEQEFGIYLTAGIGSVVSDPGQLSASYQNALIAIQQGNSCDEERIFEYKNARDASISMYFPLDFGSRVIDMISENSREKLRAWIELIFDRNKGLPNFYMKIIYMELIHEYFKLANKYHITVDMNVISGMVEQEHRLLHMKSYIMELYEILIPDGHVLQSTSDKVGSFVVEYVGAHYADVNINIVDISEKLLLSSSYVSVLFKQSMGIAFSQYLQDFRIQKAIELLEGTDDTVKEISEKVGFGTYNSFVRAFRQKIGVPPGEHRKAKREMNDWCVSC